MPDVISLNSTRWRRVQHCNTQHRGAGRRQRGWISALMTGLRLADARVQQIFRPAGRLHGTSAERAAPIDCFVLQATQADPSSTGSKRRSRACKHAEDAAQGGRGPFEAGAKNAAAARDKPRVDSSQSRIEQCAAPRHQRFSSAHAWRPSPAPELPALLRRSASIEDRRGPRVYAARSDFPANFYGLDSQRAAS